MIILVFLTWIEWKTSKPWEYVIFEISTPWWLQEQSLQPECPDYLFWFFNVWVKSVSRWIFILFSGAWYCSLDLMNYSWDVFQESDEITFFRFKFEKKKKYSFSFSIVPCHFCIEITSVSHLWRIFISYQSRLFWCQLWAIAFGNKPQSEAKLLEFLSIFSQTQFFNFSLHFFNKNFEKLKIKWNWKNIK